MEAEHALSLPDPGSGPWLVHIHGMYKGRTESFFSFSERRFYTRTIEELHKNWFWPTSQGWLLMLSKNGRRERRRCFLWNPCTLAEIQLPIPSRKALTSDCYSRCFLSSNPTDTDCTVAYVNFDRRIVFFCSRTSKNWSVLKLDQMYAEAVFFDGQLYMATGRGTVVLVDFAHLSVTTLIGDNEPDWVDYRFTTESCLIESSGEVFLVKTVYLDYYSKLVNVVPYRINFSKKRLERVDSIGIDRVFLVAVEANNLPFQLVASCSASKMKVKGDCVYVMHETRVLYVYDLDKGTISDETPCPHAKDSLPPSFWLMPPI